MTSYPDTNIFYVDFWNKVFNIFIKLSDETCASQKCLIELQDLLKYTNDYIDEDNVSLAKTISDNSLLDTNLYEAKTYSPALVIALDVIVQVISKFCYYDNTYY